MTEAEIKEYGRLFTIYRYHTTNAKRDNDNWEKFVGKTYPYDAHDPNEVKALEKFVFDNTIRLQVPIGNLTVSNDGTMNNLGSDAYEITLGPSGATAIWEGDAELLGTDEVGFFMIEFLAKAANDCIKIQNFSGYDNVTFAGGRCGGSNNPIFNVLDGQQVERIAFYYKENDSTSGPGDTEANNFKLKFSGGNPGDTVRISGLRVYKIIPNP